jgi:hypothetical protein
VTGERLSIERLEELSGLCRDAFQVPWMAAEDQCYVVGYDPEMVSPEVVAIMWDERPTGWIQRQANTRYVAAFDPPTVRALLDELLELRQRDRSSVVHAIAASPKAIAALRRSVSKLDPTKPGVA